MNCYRALLEWLILDCPLSLQTNFDPQLRHQSLLSVSENLNIDFWGYAKKALKDKPQLLTKVLKKVTKNNCFKITF